MNNQAVAKIRMHQRSQQCLWCGLVSLLTLIGVPFAMLALAARGDRDFFFGLCFFFAVLSLAGFPFALATVVMSVKVRGSEKKLWNAARPYRILGAVCAMLNIIASSVVTAIVSFLIVNRNLFGG
jgi:hypothetical protein